MILVSPDAQRHDVHLPGASVGLEPQTLIWSLLAQAKVLLSGGYPGTAKRPSAAFLAAARVMAPQWWPGGPEPLGCLLRRAPPSELSGALSDGHVDSCSANEVEINGPLCSSKLEEGSSKTCCGGAGQVAVLTAATATVVLQGFNHPGRSSLPLGPLVDPTGAGDLYAAGFSSPHPG